FILNILRTCLFVACVALISGCGMSRFAYRDTNPVVKDTTLNTNFWSKLFGDSTSFSTFSTTASRRMVVVLEKNDTATKSRTTEVCSEPSPDVGEAFASAVADAINLKAPIEGAPVELSNQYARAVSTQIASLIYRTQGLQLYRDAMHNLCVDRLNDWIKSPSSYESLKRHYFDQSFELIKAELGYIKDVGSAKAGENPNFDKVVKATVDLSKAVKPEPETVVKPAVPTTTTP
ncbi:MAG: hypothetical protein M0Q44_09415, partial [Methylobacter sp.]|nr:hypothetical protein [Methylobacter sp.]